MKSYLRYLVIVFGLIYIYWWLIIGTWNIFPVMGLEGTLLTVIWSFIIAGFVYLQRKFRK